MRLQTACTECWRDGDAPAVGGADVTPDELQRYLYEHIPISRALGVTVRRSEAMIVVLTASLGPNLNHQRSAFGGSLSALAILACWSWLHLRLRATGFHGQIVIQGNSMEYLYPALSEFTATCRAPGAERWDVFERTLSQRGRARIELDADVTAAETLVASFRGQYVALKGAQPAEY